MPEIIATYRDLDRAREAMTALERRGVGSDAVSLEGGAPARAAAEHDTSRRDGRMVAQVGKRAFMGIAVGSVLGAVLAGVIGLLVFGSLWPVVGSAIAGGIAGGALGLALAGYGTPAVSEEWELTHEDEPGGDVRVRVRSDEPDELERAAEVLRDKDAVSIERA